MLHQLQKTHQNGPHRIDPPAENGRENSCENANGIGDDIEEVVLRKRSDDLVLEHSTVYHETQLHNCGSHHDAYHPISLGPPKIKRAVL